MAENNRKTGNIRRFTEEIKTANTHGLRTVLTVEKASTVVEQDLRYKKVHSKGKKR